jgi:hypothetical protein
MRPCQREGTASQVPSLWKCVTNISASKIHFLHLTFIKRNFRNKFTAKITKAAAIRSPERQAKPTASTAASIISTEPPDRTHNVPSITGNEQNMGTGNASLTDRDLPEAPDSKPPENAYLLSRKALNASCEHWPNPKPSQTFWMIMGR